MDWYRSPAHHAAEEELKSIATRAQFAQWEKERAVVHEGKIRWRPTPYLVLESGLGRWATSRAIYEQGQVCKAVYPLIDVTSAEFRMHLWGCMKFDSTWAPPGCLIMGGSYYELPLPPLQLALWLVQLRANEDYFLRYFGLKPMKEGG